MTEKFKLVDRRTLETVMVGIVAKNHTDAYQQADDIGKKLDQRLFAIPETDIRKKPKRVRNRK